MKIAVLTTAKVIALTIILFAGFVVAGAVVRLPAAQAAEPADGAALVLLGVCLLDTLVLTWLILRSRWAGARLMLAVFVVFYGVMTLMSQIETAVFITNLPAGVLPRLFLMGAVVAGLFSVASVLVLGKGSAARADRSANSRLQMPAREWTWKLAAIAVVYVIVYFTFGYFVAWRNPAVREYYGGTDDGGFLTQMSALVREQGWLIPFQMLRAMLWTAIALPVIRMMKGPRQETALAVGVAFGVLMSAHLLIPNPYMPYAVRMAHLAETAPSNFLFGCFVGWLLARQREPHPKARAAIARDRRGYRA